MQKQRQCCHRDAKAEIMLSSPIECKDFNNTDLALEHAEFFQIPYFLLQEGFF